MIVAFGLLAALAAQDTTGLSDRARAMLDRFPPPRNGAVTIATRFSTDTAWLGQQVELVTAAWFPRELRDRLRRPPTLRAPALGGLWSAQAHGTPLLAGTRVVNGEIYDLFVAHQTLFPLGAGPIASPPAVLSYAVPTSVSFFAPEERQSLSSRPVTLVVKPIPAALAARLDNGPTARGLRLSWRAPASGLRAGTPVRVELVITGQGNVTLWPEPEIAWPRSLRVYPEPVAQAVTRPGGIVGGEKSFRFTVVPDSAGVVTLPVVNYPHFDPVLESVREVRAAALSLAVQPASGQRDRPLLPATASTQAPLATRVVHLGWPALLLMMVLPFVRRPRRRVVSVAARPVTPEARLRQLLGTPADAAPDRVGEALRRRGVPAQESAAIADWLRHHQRRRYGRAGAGESAPPPELARALERLGHWTRTVGVGVALVLAGASGLNAQTADAIERYRGGDLAGAERGFADVVTAEPRAPSAWRNLAAVRWARGDDVGAAAAWIRALELAPRDGLTRNAWQQATSLPADVRVRAPILPLSRDELVLLVVASWFAAAVAWRFRRGRLALACAALAVAAGIPAATRSRMEWNSIALVRPGSTLRVSPLATAPPLGAAPGWSAARLERREGDWLLVRLESGGRGWLPAAAVAPVGALD